MGQSSNNTIVTNSRVNVNSKLYDYITLVGLFAIIFICIISFIGWQVNNTYLRSWTSDTGGMNPITALCLIGFSFSLIIIRRNGNKNILTFLTLLIFSVVCLKYLNYFNLIDWKIDSSLLSNKIGVNIVALPTSFCLLLLSLWLLFSRMENFKSIYIFPLVSSFVSFSSFQGHLLGNKLLYSVTMALNTSFCLLLLSIIMLFIKRNSFNDLILSSLVGGKVARLFFLALFILVPGLGILVKELILINEVTLQNGISFLITGILIAGTMVIIYAGNIFNRSDIKRFDLENKNAQHSQLIKSITIPIITFNSEFVITRWNYAAEKLYGYSEQEAKGNYFSELLKINYLKNSKNTIINKLIDNDEWSGEITVTTRQNRVLNILATVSRIRSEENNSIEYIAVNKDITTIKEYENKVSDLNNELQKANDILTSQVQDLESFTAIASHDLKSPLNNIIVFAELLNDELKDNLNETAQKYLGYIKQRALFMNILIHDLLKLSSLGSKQIKLTNVNLDATVKVVIENLLELPVNIERGIEFHTEKLEFVKGDPTLIRQILENLISNSIKYTLPSQKIKITIRGHKTNGYYNLVIEDNGIGIKSKYLKDLFTPFKRFHSGFEGTGLGLAIVKRITEKLNGTIKVESTEGMGTTIILSFLSDHFIPEVLPETALNV